MSTIDELIASFHAVGAERLLLVSGKAPVLTIDGELGPMGEGAGDAHNEIERDLLEGMILIMGGEAEVGQDEFTYDSPTGQVHVTTRITERVIQVIIVPEGAAPMRPAEPVDPFAQDDEYDAVTPDAGLAEETAGWSDPPAAEGLYSNETDGAAIEPLEGFRPGAPLPTADWGNEAEDASDGLDGASSSDPDEVQHFASDDAGDENPGDERLDAATFSEQPADDGFEAPEPSFEPGPATEFPTVDVSHESSLLEPPTMDEPTDELAIDPEESSGDAACGEPFESEIEGDVEPLDQVADTSPPVLELRSDSPAMERLFLKMVGKGCSDLHVSAGAVPLFRKDGRMTDLGGEPRLSAGQAEMLLMGITPDRYRKEFEERNDVDFAYEIPGVARFRCNLFRDRNGIGGVFRQIPADILNAEQLGLHPQLLEMCQLKKGLILVTGPTGSGKSTTLAALIDHINTTRHDHIITIEDPIEFVHENKSCLINQREVGVHTAGFKVALRAALREDPDIVLVGELRDLETVEIALETAETGHLVFGTLHTNTAVGTVSRLIDQFPAGQQAQIRTMLADTLQAVISQTLCRKTKGGRVAALEILVVTNAVANLIREDKTHQISSSMQTGAAQGMKTLNDALLDLVKRKVVEPREAYWNAVDKPEFFSLLSRNGIELDGIAVATAS